MMTVYELARTGRLSGATKIGGSWRVLREEFVRWARKGGDTEDSADAQDSRIDTATACTIERPVDVNVFAFGSGGSW